MRLHLNFMQLVSGLLLIVLTGCGGSETTPQGQVSGKVLLQGQPLTSGVVTFMSETGFGLSAPLDEEGKYSLRSQYGKGIPVGTYKVTVEPPVAVAHDLATPPEKTTTASKAQIPKKYRGFSTSGFQFEVKLGSQTFDLNLVP